MSDQVFRYYKMIKWDFSWPLFVFTLVLFYYPALYSASFTFKMFAIQLAEGIPVRHFDDCASLQDCEQSPAAETPE